jgi:hypothetical protein
MTRGVGMAVAGRRGRKSAGAVVVGRADEAPPPPPPAAAAADGDGDAAPLRVCINAPLDDHSEADPA